MNFKEQIIKFSAAILFLLAILMQPVHQLEHLTHNHAHAHEAELSFINYHETHCNLCDFNFTPTLELKISNFEIPAEFNSIELTQELTSINFYKSELNLHKQLRAPPYNL